MGLECSRAIVDVQGRELQLKDLAPLLHNRIVWKRSRDGWSYTLIWYSAFCSRQVQEQIDKHQLLALNNADYLEDDEDAHPPTRLAVAKKGNMATSVAARTVVVTGPDGMRHRPSAIVPYWQLTK
jgi:hypothetical protein